MADRERRNYERIKRHFVVTYKVRGKEEKPEVSQIKDISEGGMFFTTSKNYLAGTILEVKLKTPISSLGINLLAKVIESEEVAPQLIYNTRVAFLQMDTLSKSLLKETVDFFIRKIKKEG
jgi:c-di-GMP-binding flagellar brake protein YcgR